MNRSLAEKFVKYIAEMAIRLERKSWIDVDEVDALNRELDLFKRKLAEENGLQSRQFLDLKPLHLVMDPKYLEGTSSSGVAAILAALGNLGPLSFLLGSDSTTENRQRLQDFKDQLREYLYRFDDYRWEDGGS